MTSSVARPGAAEHDSYYSTYIDQVPDGDVLVILSGQIGTTLDLLASVPPDLEQYRYEPDKWSVREVVGHVIDAERVFAHRAFSFARADAGPLPGMDQLEYATASTRRCARSRTSPPSWRRSGTRPWPYSVGFRTRRGHVPVWRAVSRSRCAASPSSSPVTRSIIERDSWSTTCSCSAPPRSLTCRAISTRSARPKGSPSPRLRPR